MSGKEQLLSCGRWDENVSWEFFCRKTHPIKDFVPQFAALQRFRERLLLLLLTHTVMHTKTGDTTIVETTIFNNRFCGELDRLRALGH